MLSSRTLCYILLLFFDEYIIIIILILCCIKHSEKYRIHDFFCDRKVTYEHINTVVDCSISRDGVCIDLFLTSVSVSWEKIFSTSAVPATLVPLQII